MEMQELLRIIAQHGPTAIFDEDKARPYLNAAMSQIVGNTRAAAASVRLPELRDKIESTVRLDILSQSYHIFGMLGRMELALILHDQLVLEKRPENTELIQILRKTFAAMYMQVCMDQDSLQALCRATVQTLLPKDYVEKQMLSGDRRVVDKDF